MPIAIRRVFCVEDHADTRSMLTKLLEREGYYVIAAEDATVGLALAHACALLGGVNIIERGE